MLDAAAAGPGLLDSAQRQLFLHRPQQKLSLDQHKYTSPTSADRGHVLGPTATHLQSISCRRERAAAGPDVLASRARLCHGTDGTPFYAVTPNLGQGIEARAQRNGGGGGIRTHGGLPLTRFPSVPIRPLSHPSRVATQASGNPQDCR